MALFLKLCYIQKCPIIICILITDFESYVFSGQNIYIDIHLLLIYYFLLLINIHIVLHKEPKIEPINNIQFIGFPIFAVI